MSKKEKRKLLHPCDFKTSTKGSDRLLGVGLETVFGLTGYHCLSELFSDLGIAQCCLVFGCSLIRLCFLHHLSVLLQQWNNRMVQDSVD